MAKLHADKAAGCISHTKFTPADIARLEARVASLKETHEFDDENHAYIEAATRIAHEARGHSELILAALHKEDKAKAAEAPPVPPTLSKFDNIPDLADAIAKENAFPQAVAEAYVQHTELGRPLSKIAKTLGIGKSTAGEMVQKMKPLMDAAKKDRLEKGAGHAQASDMEKALTPLEPIHTEEAAPDQKAPADETVDEDAPEAPVEELTASGELADEDNPSQGQEPRTEQGHVNISDNPHGEGETKAKNDTAAEKAYAGKADPVARARWEALSMALLPKKRVAWNDLGPGQKAGFSEEAKKGKAEEAFASTMAMVKEGIKLATAQEVYLPNADGKVAGVDGALTRAIDMVGAKLAALVKKYPVLITLSPSVTLRSVKDRFIYNGLDADQLQVVGAALDNLLRSHAAPFVKHALSSVRYIGTFVANKGDTKTGAAFISGMYDSLIFNERFVPSAFDSRAPLLTTSFLAHELTHAADMTPTGEWASMNAYSPTRVFVNYGLGDQVGFKMNPVAQEAYDAYLNDQAKWKDFDQAIGPLGVAIEDIANNNGNAGALTDEHLAKVVENASTELSPKLMELYLVAPELLKQLPLAYAHAQAIALADSARTAHDTLGGANAAARTQATQRAGAVHGQVQSPTDASPGARDRTVQVADGAVGGGRQNSPGAADLSGQGREGWLSAAFKRWFGDSKIVNADGTPMKMYHGTARDIEQFTPKQAGAIFVTGNSGVANNFALSSEEWVANHLTEVMTKDELRKNDQIHKEMMAHYALLQGDTTSSEDPAWSARYKALGAARQSLREQVLARAAGQNIMPVYVRAETPMDYTNREQARALAVKVGEMVRGNKFGAHVRFGLAAVKLANDNSNELPGHYDMRDAYGGGVMQLENDISRGSWQVIESKQVQAAIKALGHDSFYVRENGVKNLAVYSSNQIKSATGNNGDYSTTDERIAAATFAADVPPPITGGAGVLNWLKALTEGKWRAMPGLLGFLSTEQMADRWKDIPMVKAFSDTMAAMGGRANAILSESDKHSTQWAALRKRFGPAVETKFSQMMLDATTANTWPDRDVGAEGNKHLSAADAAVVAEHARLRNEYRALPAEYQTLFHNVVADQAAHRAASIAGLRRGIIEAYHPMPGKQGPLADTVDAAAKVKAADRAAFLAAHAKSANDATTLNKMWTDLDEHAKTFPTLPGPYFPKMRFGDHIVHYKTKAFQAQETAVAHANEVIQGLMNESNYAPVLQAEADIKSAESRLKRSTRPEHRDLLKQDIADSKAARESLLAPIAAARKLLAEQQNKLMLMKADGANYGVEFYENRALAQVNQARLAAHFGTEAVVSRDIKDQFLRSMDGVTPEFVRTLEHKMSKSLTGVDSAKVSNAVRELYLRLQPENSALKRQLKRANVSGVRADEAHRAYATSAMRSAHSISRLEYGDTLNKHLNEMRFNRTDEDTKLIGNELAKRIAQNMAEPTDMRAVSLLTNATYLSYLGMSPSFMVTQITQPWVISAPIMAGKHGIRATGRLLSQAGVDAAKLLKGSYDADKRWKYHLDPELGVKENIITADEAKMLQEMLDRGRIDITITHDLGATSSGADNSMMARAAAIASYPAQQLEMANRVSTALAGYRAEREAGAQHLEAAQYADTLVADTHLNYSAANRARHMHANSFGGWGRVMFQFRAYQQGMLYLIYKNMMDGARGDKNARRSLAYLAGMQLATAGLAGMPVPGVMAIAISMLYKSLTDDDEEKDLKEMLYQGVKSVVGETGATAVMKGIPAALGVDVSSKVGLGNIAEAVPYANDKKVGGELVKEYFAGLAGGAATGMVMNWANATHEASQGNFLKAAGQAAPAALANPLKAYGYAAHGMVDSRGNQVLAAEEMSAASAAVKAFGFQPTEVSRVQDQRSAFFEAKKNRNDVRAKLIQDFARARTEGSDPSAIREDVAGFNERHPDDRITPTTLEKAVALQRARTRNMRHGVPVGKHDRALAEELGIE
jgi:hypothetical protein